MSFCLLSSMQILSYQIFLWPYGQLNIGQPQFNLLQCSRPGYERLRIF